MKKNYMTPGVYITEENTFPISTIAVETAVPVFIGYTEKADRDGKSILGKPTKITSLYEFITYFGGSFRSRFSLNKAKANDKNSFKIGTDDMVVNIMDKNTSYFYNAIRSFYHNGGNVCYILSVKVYGDELSGTQAKSLDVSEKDFFPEDREDVFTILEKEPEPTIVIMPDVVSLAEKATELYKLALQHCAKMQSRFGIFDVYMETEKPNVNNIEVFRDGIGMMNLDYGAAYYPYLNTTVVQNDEVDYRNLDDLTQLQEILVKEQLNSIELIEKVKEIMEKVKRLDPPAPEHIKTYHESLKAISPIYGKIMEEIRSKLNLLPPSGAIAGIYTSVDASRGVWKAPANISLNTVNSPAILISSQEQEQMNVDVNTGKSINVIRSFPGIGTLVWGARTLDGNSTDWKYINVKRTLIMIEQSLKLAIRNYVFEPNDTNTWVNISSMFDNFLNNLWKQGALAGAVPQQAYNVQIGLGSTMTPEDILLGILRVNVMVAIVRPAEFIVLTLTQQQQKS